ncbi:MAG: ribonuclease HII [Lactobacillales bacterium]|nr:ribonuclease HII [Lactobacillales bacterium]
MRLYEYEEELIKNGIKYIGGTDEAGRGPLIGPVVAACVVLPLNYQNEIINDSKKLTEKKREELYDVIMNDALSVGIGIVDANVIDEINIYEASKLAMIKAYKEANKNLKIEHLLTDAMELDIEIPFTKIIKGDAKSITIAAASIIAKVTRDRMLLELDRKYPMYGFKNHKGYPTKKHIEAIHKYGLIEGYRKTYGPVKEMLEEIK